MRRPAKKRKWEWLRYRKGDATHNLFVAAQRFVHANKGTAVVMGGPVTVHEAEFEYIVGIRCVGKPPIKKEASSGV